MMHLIQRELDKTGKFAVSSEMHAILKGVWHDRLTPYAIVLTHLAACNFNVHRFPTRPDRSLDENVSERSEAVALLDKYTDVGLQKLKTELKELTTRTQNLLSRVSLQQAITLQRAISPLKNTQYQYANRKVDNVELYPTLALAAQQANLQSICIDMDIVSGWSTTSLQRYGSLHLTRQWPVCDILLVSDMLEGPDKSLGALESNEWLCVNRDERGLVEFPISDIRLEDLTPEVTQKVARSKAVQMLASELQQEATEAATKRNLGLRPTPTWWNSETKLPAGGLIASLMAVWKTHNARH
jgi:hypothetical protein